MSSEEEFIQNYQANESIWESKNSTNCEKASAWRKQLLLLEHLTTNDSYDNIHYDLMKHHFDKWETNPNVSENFINDRVKNVRNILKGFQIKKNSNGANNVPEIDGELFEASCHGEYQSCAHKEITNDELQIFKERQDLPYSRDDNMNSSNYKVNSLVPTPIPAQGAQKSSMTNFLQNSNQTRLANTLHQNNTVNQNSLYTKAAGVVPRAEANLGSERPNQNEGVLSEFRTAREELLIQNSKKYGGTNSGNQAPAQTPLFNYGQTKKSLGARRNVRSGFVPPIRAEDNASNQPVNNGPGNVASNFNSNVLGSLGNVHNSGNSLNSQPVAGSPNGQTISPSPPLANIDPKMVELITNEIMHKYKPIAWDDIAGLEYAKSIIKEAVVYPLLRPDIFTGLRRPPRGILLFGPPGTGKTLIGKCIASQSKSTFFSISASSLTSKWIGDGEKMVRALFAVAAVHQPSVVFIDEIDSLLSQRSETEHESSRRLKNEFLIQLDGAATSDDDRILIVGATNRPQELDEAARRRLVRRLYIPLPEHAARIQILNNLLKTVRNDLSDSDIQEIGSLTSGYSGADMDTLCREASMEPIRSIPPEEMAHFKEDNVRPVNMQDFHTALQNVRPSVSSEDLKQYLEWNKVYGAKR